MFGCREPIVTRPRGYPYEGAFASRKPFANIGGGQYAVGPTDIAMGRFGWVANGQVSNVQSPNAPLGLILPRFGLWSLCYFQAGAFYLRAGKNVTLAARGDFWVRFPNGAFIGAPVYADPASGIAYAADGGGFERTAWTVITNAGAGGLAIISPYSFIGGS